MNLNMIKYAYIRGTLKDKYNDEVFTKNLDNLTEEDCLNLEEIGKENNLKLYYFKEKENLARVNIVLGFLKSIYPTNILDVGSGRGVFLFPLLIEFPFIEATSIDILERRVELLNNINKGGIDNLEAKIGDICSYNEQDDSYDVVTLLEVLEHIPNVNDAVKNAVRLSRQFIVVTVPSKEDDNPEHIHLLTKEKLTKLFNDAGVTNLKFGGVNGHLFLVARK